MRTFFGHALPAALALACISSPVARGEVLLNGGFEGFGGSDSSNIGAGIDHWTIGGGIDIMELSAPNYWQAGEGDVSLSLNWIEPSTISQTVATTAGQAYRLRFLMAAEIYGGPPERTMDIAWNGSVVGSPSFAYTGQPPEDMGWTPFSLVVVGTGSDVLEFRSTTPDNYGPALDGVSLTAIPEPGTLVLLLVGISGGTGLVVRRYRG